MKKRAGLGIVIAAFIIACFVGWKLLSRQQAYENYESDQNIVYVAFSKEGEKGEPMDYKEIADYQSTYSNYNSRLMYNALTNAEQQIYRFFEYALDNEYTDIFFDSRLLEDVELSLDEILQIYSMDSPLVQQNYSYSSYETGYTFSYLGETFTFEVPGTAFCVEGFSHEAMQKKKEAIEAAEAVFDTMPKGLSQLEQARFFFRYLTREVKYTLNEGELWKQDNLYDAFVVKKTQCDGFSNAFSLLCAMANIDCAEKIASPEDEEEIGHTWNIFCAEGVWYNADLALSEEYAKLHKQMDVDFSFGFSDSKTEYIPDLAERFPKCTTDLLPTDLTVTSASDPNLLRGLKSAFKKSGKRFVCICLEKGELSDKDLQKIANYLNFDIRAVKETQGGKACYYIFKD